MNDQEKKELLESWKPKTAYELNLEREAAIDKERAESERKQEELDRIKSMRVVITQPQKTGYDLPGTVHGPDWLEAHRGNKVIRSQRLGILMQRSVLAPLQALIALCSGRSKGDFEALEHIVTNSDLICEVCQQNLRLSKGCGFGVAFKKHKPDCDLAQWCYEVIAANDPYLNENEFDLDAELLTDMAPGLRTAADNLKANRV